LDVATAAERLRGLELSEDSLDESNLRSIRHGVREDATALRMYQMKSASGAKACLIQ